MYITCSPYSELLLVFAFAFNLYLYHYCNRFVASLSVLLRMGICAIMRGTEKKKNSSKSVPRSRCDRKTQGLSIVIFPEPHTHAFISWLCHRLFSFCAVTFARNDCTFSKSAFLTATVELARLPQL